MINALLAAGADPNAKVKTSDGDETPLDRFIEIFEEVDPDNWTGG